MPKSVSIEDFAAKLALVAKRLNVSAGKLAQQVGVDKSVVARWLNGDSRPTAHSLMQLTAIVAQTVDGLTAADWDLPREQFRQRLGIAPVVVLPTGETRAETRLRFEGLKYPPDPRWATPYLGLWAGFFQSMLNHGIPQLVVMHFAMDDLGLHAAFTVGPLFGDGPVLASSSHLQCFLECAPLFDRVVFCVLYGVHQPQARVVDGIVCVMAGDAAGTPAASPILLYRIDDGIAFDPVTGMEELGATISRLNEHAKVEAHRSGDAFAVMSDLAPVEILQTVCPVVGAPREGGVDHVLRVPAARSLAAGTLDLEGAPADAPMRTIPANLRRALGLERGRPALRLLGTAKD
jgi:transcriptional regulator with XRE-family HTH domain